MSLMITATRSTLATTLWMATLLLSAWVGTAHAVGTPTALAAVASATPQFKLPVGEPQKLVPQTGNASGAGGSGPASARGEGKVAADRPLAFLFRAETGGLYSIGVSSPQNAAHIAIYRGSSTQFEPGTAPADGAIRWSSDIAAGATVKIVVYTGGSEIPFLIEASLGPGGV